MKTYISSELLNGAGAVNAVSLRIEGKPNYFSMRRNGTSAAGFVPQAKTVGGVEADNRRDFFLSVGFDEACVASGEQVHGDNIELVESPGCYPRTDALVTRNRNLLLAISTADCVPVLMVDKGSKTVAAVHAGWRGTSKQIVAKAVEFMLQEIHSRPENIFASIGPSAGVCCYKVGREVAENFSPGFVKESPELEKFMLDLKAANLAQLVSKGIPQGNIEVSEHCTICNTNFHSYRRDGESSGGMLAVIAIK